MEIPKILQAKRNGTFYDYIEKSLNKDPIYGNMSNEDLVRTDSMSEEIEFEASCNYIDNQDIITESKTPWEDRQDNNY